MPNTFTFDSEQSKAINLNKKSIIVSASAGAGKTGMLVGRLLKRCVEDQIPLQEILAVTFTKAAAADMKRKFAKALNGALQDAENNKDQMKVQYIQEQLIALDVANIMTIDSYCLNIIKKYYSVIGLNPATTKNLISDGKKENLQKKAFLDAYKELYRRNPDVAIKLATSISVRSEDYDSLYEVVKKILSCVDSVIDPQAWYQHTEEQYKVINRFSDFPKDIRDALYNSLLVRLQDIQLLLEKLNKIGQHIVGYDPQKTKVKQNDICNMIAALNAEDYNRYIEELKTFSCHATTSIGKDINAEYKSIRDRLAKKTKALLSDAYEPSRFVSDSNDLYDFVHELLELTKRSKELFQQYKAQEACMDFSDMERFALEILENKFVADEISDSLQEIMIDEFQDTSELQNEIIMKIAKNDNVFRVGDVKQSIYAFRQAKPSLMRSLMKDPSIVTINLQHNYRSKSSVVEFTNLLFTKLMNITGYKDTYTQIDNVTIGNPGRQSDPTPVPVTFVQINSEPIQVGVVPQDDNDTDDDNGYVVDVTNEQKKAIYIADKIIEMRNADPSLTFGSFAVLTPTNAQKVFLKAAFDQANIDYDIDTHEGFYKSPLCQVLSSMCFFMIDPKDQVSLVSILTSSFYNMGDEELADLKNQYGSVLKGIKETRPDILDELEELHQIEIDKDILEMLNEIANRHDFYDHLASTQKVNFDFLYDKLLNSDIHTLSEFIEEINASGDDKSSEATSKGKDDDFVNVSTIHHSKGLEYRIVFLWSTENKANNIKKDPVLVDSDLGLGLNHFEHNYTIKRPTIQRLGILNKLEQDELEESIRLLYVALTRAEDRLFVVDVLNYDYVPQTVTQSVVNLRRGMSGLILSAIGNGTYFNRVIEDVQLNVYQSYVAKSYSTVLPRFNQQVTEIHPMMTPSSTEIKTLPPLAMSQGTAGSSYGTLMHEFAAKLPNREWTEDDFVNTLLSDAGIKDLITFSRTDLYKECIQGEVHKEYPFYIETPTVRVNGTMDFVSILKDKIILIDYKTDNATVEEIKSRYQSQLNEYIKALHIMFPNIPVVAYAYSFHNNVAIEILEIK